MTRAFIPAIALIGALLSGCAQTLASSNELHAALTYAPQPTGVSEIAFAGPADPCGTGLGVERVDQRPDAKNNQFVALPGMTLQVSQGTARLSGASDAPVLSTWTWRLPNTSSAGARCPSAGRWSDRDMLVVRTLLHGARKLRDDNEPQGLFDQRLWGLSIRCAVTGSNATEGPCTFTQLASGNGEENRRRVVDNFLAPFVASLRLSLRNDVIIYPNGPDKNAETIAAQALYQSSDFPGSDPDPLIECGGTTYWESHQGFPPPPIPCERAYKTLALQKPRLTMAHVPALADSYALLQSSDRLMLAAPGVVRSMINPSFDLAGTRPGSGHEDSSPQPGAGPDPIQAADALASHLAQDDEQRTKIADDLHTLVRSLSATGSPQKPLAGEAYQGFVDLDLMIPVRIAGERSPRLVPVYTTVAVLEKLIGRKIAGVSRLAGWFPARVSVVGKSTTQPVAPSDGRITIRFARNGWDSLRAPAAWRGDMLVAPGDLFLVD